MLSRHLRQHSCCLSESLGSSLFSLSSRLTTFCSELIRSDLDFTCRTVHTSWIAHSRSTSDCSFTTFGIASQDRLEITLLLISIAGSLLMLAILRCSLSMISVIRLVTRMGASYLRDVVYDVNVIVYRLVLPILLDLQRFSIRIIWSLT